MKVTPLSHHGIPAAEQACRFTHDFSHQGRQYCLFKREQIQDAPWYLEAIVQGRRVKRSMGTNQGNLAETRAKGILTDLKAKHWERVPTLKSAPGSGLTLGELWDAYVANAQELASKTRVGIWSAWVSVLHRTDPGINPKEFRLSNVNGALVNSFRQRLQAEYLRGAVTEQDRKAALQRMNRSGQSYLNQAKSVFARQRLASYAAAGIVMPEGVAEFVEACTGAFRAARNVAEVYVRPSDELIRQTFEATLKLIGGETAEAAALNRNVYLAFWLAVGCGMRKGEVAACQWEWFVRKGDQGYISSAFIGKGGETLDIPVIEDAWRRIDPFYQSHGFVIEGRKTERTEAVFRRLGAWMAGLGWNGEKKIHELRKYVGSKIAQSHGVTAAAMFLRHKQIRTLEKFYLRYLTLQRVDVKLG
jgi:integrase